MISDCMVAVHHLKLHEVRPEIKRILSVRWKNQAELVEITTQTASYKATETIGKLIFFPNIVNKERDIPVLSYKNAENTANNEENEIGKKKKKGAGI